MRKLQKLTQNKEWKWIVFGLKQHCGIQIQFCATEDPVMYNSLNPGEGVKN